MEVHLTSMRCQSCGEWKPNWQPLYPEIALFRCIRCASFSFLSDAELKAHELYSEGYFGGGEYYDYLGHSRSHVINFSQRWQLLTKYASVSDIRLFEEGCAYGLFIDFALRAGAKAAFGCDISKSAINYAQANFGRQNFGLVGVQQRPAFTYNCLVAWDVWEHLENPFDHFSDLVRDLEAGGIFAVSTVDASSVVARIRGRHWRQVHPPTHVHYPTRSALLKAFRSMGLDVLYQGHIAQYRALEAYVAVFGLDKLLRPFPTLRTLPIPLDLRDAQLIIGRK